MISINYKMEDRFGRDDNQNGMMDLRNTCEYVYNLPTSSCDGGIPAEEPKFNVMLEGDGEIITYLAGQPQKRYEFTADIYRWEITGPGINGSLKREHPESQWSVNLQEGEYWVNLTVQGQYGDGQVAMQSFSIKIEVKDILIVSIGDSYASGEGNPEKINFDHLLMSTDGGESGIYYEPAWADDGVSTGIPFKNNVTSQVGMDHFRSHRSTLSGPAQAALAIERAQAHSSVTFVSAAESGATINEILKKTDYDGAVNPFGLPVMDAQIDQVRNMVGNRKIDYLFISIGGNDSGFANILTSLLLRGSPPNPFGPSVVCSGDMPYCLIDDAIHSGNWNLVENYFTLDLAADLDNTSGLDALNSHLYYDLDQAIVQSNLMDANGHIRITNYPDPFYYTGDNKQIYWCQEIMDSIINTPRLEIGSNELKWAREHAYLPLNQAVKNAAEKNGWWLADIQGRFYGHGYCANEPYPSENYPGNPFPNIVQPWPTSPAVRWFRRAGESEKLQGGDRKSTKGTMHPNEFGHQAIAEELSGSIIILLNSNNPPPNPSLPLPIITPPVSTNTSSPLPTNVPASTDTSSPLPTDTPSSTNIYPPSSTNPPPTLSFAEDCVSINITNVRLYEQRGNWWVAEGDRIRILYLYFGANESEAQNALNIIQYYGMDKKCTVGLPDPSFEYWLVNTSSPIGSYPGEDCISFNPNNILLQSVDGRSRLVDFEGVNSLSNYTEVEDDTQKAHEILQYYGFNNICFVGRPDPSMIYFRR